MKPPAFPPFYRLLAYLSLSLLAGCISAPEKPDPTPQQVATPKSIDPAGMMGDIQMIPPPVEATTDLMETPAVQHPPKDVWERIRRGMSMSVPDEPRIQSELRWLQRHPAYLERTSRRAEPYIHHIVEAAERRQLPLELTLLPVVESGFQPLALSPYRAAGLWQFIPSTGKAFGLKNTWWYEGRCDVTASTDAAMDYLTSLSRQFDGDWALALAAYNAGPYTVRKAIKRNRQRGRPTDYWHLDLPKETRQYVPRVLAVAEAVRNPDLYGISLAPVPNQAHFALVTLPRQIDLNKASKLSGVDVNTLKQLNPGLRRWATDPDGPHNLLLPVDKVDGFKTKLAELDTDQWVTMHRYRIKRGDSLGRIAHRYGISTSELKRANNLRGSRIRAGRHLIIPVPGDGSIQVARAERPPKKRATRSGKRGSGGISHTVQPGDTLWDIARAYKVNHKQLAAWNGLSVNDTLRPGQSLKIRTGNSKKGGSFYYRVQPGDSLYKIALRFNVTIEKLRRWNSLSGRYLKPGQQLTLYL